MGKTFAYIDDDVLPEFAEPGRCDWCHTETALFTIYIDANGNPGDRACIRCIKTLPLRWIRPKDNERLVSSMIQQRYPKGSKSQNERFALTVELADEYRRTPCLPNFIQHDDWPHCCGDFTEYIGDAGTTRGAPYDDFQWWGDRHDPAAEHGIAGVIGGENRVSLFRCLHCPSKFWTFQCT